MPNEGEIGKRLLPSLIDWLAQNEPQRVWASVPINDNDLGKGYEDISFRQFANAISEWNYFSTDVANLAIQIMQRDGSAIILRSSIPAPLPDFRQ